MTDNAKRGWVLSEGWGRVRGAGEEATPDRRQRLERGPEEGAEEREELWWSNEHLTSSDHYGVRIRLWSNLQKPQKWEKRILEPRFPSDGGGGGGISLSLASLRERESERDSRE